MNKPSFKSLKFISNKAVLPLRNGYTAIVRTGRGTATTIGAKYEFELVPMNLDISDDRIGYCNERDITSLLRECDSLRPIDHRPDVQFPKFDW